MAKKRSIKVYGQSGYKYQETPTIMLKGMWLKELGFDIGDYISVTCEDGRLVITPDAERAAVANAEKAFMDKGLSDLRKRFQKEKEQHLSQAQQIHFSNMNNILHKLSLPHYPYTKQAEDITHQYHSCYTQLSFFHAKQNLPQHLLQ